MIPYKKEDALRVWPEGDYPASIVKVEERVSKAGNPMLAVEFDAYHKADTMRLTDYIVLPSFTWKLRKLARALSAMDAFDAEKFDPAEYIGKSLTLTLGIDLPRGGYDERNSIAAYGPPGAAHPGAPADDGIF